MDKRIIWPDFCKFVAMFLVTWGHASQVISGQTFNNLLGGATLVAVHMPLFFIISGYFINLEKMRIMPLMAFIKQKFVHYMLPAIVWTAIYCLLTLTPKGPLSFLTFYWYLFSLFLSNLIIFLCSKMIKKNVWVILLSLVLVICLPYTDIGNLNFMLPFLWVGYLLRVFPPKHPVLFVVIAIAITIGLSQIWDWNYTVYLSRFNIAHITLEMLIKYIVRFAIGVSASYIIIFISQKYDYKRTFVWLSRYGKYTLITYLVSLALFGVMRKYITIQIAQPGLLDVVSFVLCVLTYALSVNLQRLLIKNRYTRLLLLGITNE